MIDATLLASVAGTALEKGAEAAGTVASGAAHGAAASLSDSVAPYDADRLFRSASAETDSSTTDGGAEVTRILGKGISTGDVPTEDRTT